MQITVGYLKQKRACQEMIDWFGKTYTDDAGYQAVMDALERGEDDWSMQLLKGAPYQTVLDELAKENRSDWASWLIRTAEHSNR